MVTSLLSLLVASVMPTLGTGTALPVSTQDPSIRLWVSDNGRFVRGERGKVEIRAARDGYLVVLHADAEGRIRPLFPLDPRDDNFVRGGKKYEIRDRGGRDAFYVDESDGTGTVYAAWSRDPFQFSAFTRGDHWDFYAFAESRLDDADEAEVELTEVVRRMGVAFEYDLAHYQVAEPRSYVVHTTYAGGYDYYDPFWYDPFYYRCWSCGSVYYGSGIHIGIGYGYPYRRYHSPYWYDPYYYRPVVYYPTYPRYYGDFPRDRWRYPTRTGVGPADRFADGRYRFKTPQDTRAGGGPVDYRDRRRTFAEVSDRRPQVSPAPVDGRRRTPIARGDAPGRVQPADRTPAADRRRSPSRPEGDAARPAPQIDRRRVEPADRPTRVEPDRPATEPRRADPKQDQPRREEPRRAEPKRDEPRRDEPRRAEPRRDGPSRAQPARTAPARADRAGETRRAEPARSSAGSRSQPAARPAPRREARPESRPARTEAKPSPSRDRGEAKARPAPSRGEGKAPSRDRRRPN